MSHSLMHGYWTRARVIDAIQEFARIYGRPPSARDWNVGMAKREKRPDLADRFYEDACWPHVGTVYGANGHFPSWRSAIEAAGFESRAPGKRGPTSDYAREHLLPLAKSRTPQTHCKRGHEFTPENTYRLKNQRICKACNAMRARAYHQRRKAALTEASAAGRASACSKQDSAT